MNRRDRFDAYDTNSGKYSASKVPEWNFSSASLIAQISEIETDDEDPGT